MSTNKTTNLNLHSWVGSDPFRMNEFNENFAAIDAAVGGKAEQSAVMALQAAAAAAGNCNIAVGSYTGNGQSTRTIPLPFTPKLMLMMGYTGNYGALFFLTQEITYIDTASSTTLFQGEAALSGDQLLLKTVSANTNAKNYYYVLFA